MRGLPRGRSSGSVGWVPPVDSPSTLQEDSGHIRHTQTEGAHSCCQFLGFVGRGPQKHTEPCNGNPESAGREHRPTQSGSRSKDLSASSHITQRPERWHLGADQLRSPAPVGSLDSLRVISRLCPHHLREAVRTVISSHSEARGHRSRIPEHFCGTRPKTEASCPALP